MAEIVNLRQLRKRKARAEAGKAADANRALFGRSNAEKARDRAEKQSRDALLDGHRRVVRKPTDEA
jgi:hypothetical protein